VTLGAGLIFILRNWSFFKIPNFLVEDATVIYANVFTNNAIDAITTTFNGYLIVGQYLLAYVALGLNGLVGSGLDTLPIVTAVVACLFLGLAASLPYILFRKELGTKLSLVVVLLTALVPMYSYDYAILSSLSNLKFVFLYIAFMLILYRYKRHSLRGYIIIDSLLLLSVLTNATVVVLTPLLFLPLLPSIRERKRFLQEVLSGQVISAVIVSVLSVTYVLLAVSKGIVTPPGYLDAPLQAQSVLPLLDRSTTFAWLYPITSVINSYFVISLFGILAVYIAHIFKREPAERLFIAVFLWTIVSATVLLLTSRSGLGTLFTTYVHKGGPDQFFYAQNMVVIFATLWLLRKQINKLRGARVVMLVALGLLYLLLAIPHGSSLGGSTVVYKEMGTIDHNLEKACKLYPGDEVVVQIYPTPYWQWRVDRARACQ